MQMCGSSYFARAHHLSAKVRNHCEAEIGHFQPPKGGAEFIDPKAASIGIVIGPASVQGGDSRCATVTSFLSGSACPRRRRFQGKPCGLAAFWILDLWLLKDRLSFSASFAM